jgi:hypothetical protein
MNNDFKTLVDFLERFGPEASGRELPGPPAEAAAKLQRFADGACAADERGEVCELLRQHPAWLRWLADRVKMARESTGAAANGASGAGS